jgi:succinate-acetate transporter protein
MTIDAEKLIQVLGEAGTFAYQIALSKVYGDAMAYLAWSVGLLAVVIIALVLIGWHMRHTRNMPELNGDHIAVRLILWGVFVLALIAGVSCSAAVLQRLLAPDYYAVQELLTLANTLR